MKFNLQTLFEKKKRTTKKHKTYKKKWEQLKETRDSDIRHAKKQHTHRMVCVDALIVSIGCQNTTSVNISNT
jgi:hypothetical protein